MINSGAALAGALRRAQGQYFDHTPGSRRIASQAEHSAAEDNPVNRMLAQKLLQKHGHTVTSVNNGREALQLWEQNQPRQFAVILMDVQMPEMDGLQATSGIRE